MTFFKERLGLVLVVVVSGVVTALIRGNGLVAAGLGIGGVLLLAALAGRPRRPSSSEGLAQTSKQAGHQYSFQYAWETRIWPDLDQITGALAQLELRPNSESPSRTSAVLRGGNQLWTRLFGGYFVDPRKLPVQAELSIKPNNAQEKYALALTVRDTLGVAVRDKGLEARYAQAASKIKEIVESTIDESH